MISSYIVLLCETMCIISIYSSRKLDNLFRVDITKNAIRVLYFVFLHITLSNVISNFILFILFNTFILQLHNTVRYTKNPLSYNHRMCVI